MQIVDQGRQHVLVDGGGDGRGARDDGDLSLHVMVHGRGHHHVDPGQRGGRAQACGHRVQRLGRWDRRGPLPRNRVRVGRNHVDSDDPWDRVPRISGVPARNGVCLDDPADLGRHQGEVRGGYGSVPSAEELRTAEYRFGLTPDSCASGAWLRIVHAGDERRRVDQGNGRVRGDHPRRWADRLVSRHDVAEPRWNRRAMDAVSERDLTRRGIEFINLLVRAGTGQIGRLLPDGRVGRGERIVEDRDNQRPGKDGRLAERRVAQRGIGAEIHEFARHRLDGERLDRVQEQVSQDGRRVELALYDPQPQPEDVWWGIETRRGTGGPEGGALSTTTPLWIKLLVPSETIAAVWNEPEPPSYASQISVAEGAVGKGMSPPFATGAGVPAGVTTLIPTEIWI